MGRGLPKKSRPQSHTGTPGAVLVVPVGPLQGENPASTRIPSGDVITRVGTYVEGTTDADGNPILTANQIQLRPVTMLAGNYVVSAPIEDIRAVSATVLMAPEYAFSFVAGGYTIAAGSWITTGFTVTPAPSTLPANQQIKPRSYLAIQAPVRGGFFITSVATVNATTGAITVNTPLPLAPTVGQVVLPATAQWAAIRSAIYPVFDTLGPGDTTSSPASPIAASRWPFPQDQGRPTLYVAQLLAAILSVPGVIDAAVSVPGSDVDPAPLHLLMLGTLTLATM